jgi:hypothetical protein
MYFDSFAESEPDRIHKKPVLSRNLRRGSRQNLNFFKFYFTVYCAGVSQKIRVETGAAFFSHSGSGHALFRFDKKITVKIST